MAESEDKGFEVVDKRKVKLGENGEVEAQAEAEIPEPEPGAKEQTSAEQAAEEMEELPPVDVYSLLRSFIGLLSAQTWQWLGLVKNPVTGKMEQDLEQAKVAIDAIAGLAKHLEGKADQSEQAELKALLSNLQINYVQQNARKS